WPDGSAARRPGHARAESEEWKKYKARRSEPVRRSRLGLSEPAPWRLWVDVSRWNLLLGAAVRASAGTPAGRPAHTGIVDGRPSDHPRPPFVRMPPKAPVGGV